MAKTPPEKLAAALRANLKRRKQQPPPSPATDTSKDPEKIGKAPEKIGEKPLAEAARPPRGT